MQIRWTEEASDSIEQTLDYWYRNNGTFSYSEKILNETEKVEKEILSNPYSKQYSDEPTLKSKACLKCLYFTIIIFDLCRYLEYFSYLCTINQTE